MTNLPAESPGSDNPVPSDKAGPGGMRASDSDRERVAEALREAAAEGRLDLEELNDRLDLVFAAKTYAELEPITADLPTMSPNRGTRPETRPDSSGINRYGGEASEHVAVAIMGGFSRKGSWVVPPVMSAVAIMGGGELDLRDARFSERVVTIHVTAIMGGIEITVPDDARVEVNGIGIMGGFDHSATGEGSADGPTIIINGLAFWGGVEVKRRPSRSGKLERRTTPELGG
ncbi:MAG TPA: DUF1707 domain-containing protein [Trebonia sp.]|nr:DUF1707 domain-containing protein [Trebonia sp.]